MYEKVHAPFEERAEQIIKIRNFIADNRHRFLELLTQIATYRSAESEIQSTINALDGAFDEVEKHRPPRVESMAVFMPSNVILYSYALYLLIPSLYTNRISFRSSSHVLEQMKELHQLISSVVDLPIEMKIASQREFMQETVLQSKVVVFTGTYKNAEKIKLQLKKDQLYMFFGQGINPFIIGKEAHLEKAVNDIVDIRLFNSGQDCMGPDMLFVHESVCKEFLALLEEKLGSLTFGLRTDANADYSPIYYTDILTEIGEYLKNHQGNILYGGTIDYRTSTIHPTILKSHIKDGLRPIEFFSPIFNVIEYEDEQQLKDLLDISFYRERSMGASVYGCPSMIEFLKKKHTVTVECTMGDVENGNEPFGGYGAMANYIVYQGKMETRPILISEVVASYLSQEKQSGE